MFEGQGVSTETVYTVTRASSYILVNDPHRQIKTAAIALAKFGAGLIETYLDEWPI